MHQRPNVDSYVDIPFVINVYTIGTKSLEKAHALYVVKIFSFLLRGTRGRFTYNVHTSQK